MEDYRVQLDFYDGPMDLLLYLVRKDEVDINDIPIARVTEQYCRYVEMLRVVDINLAGEFLLMAAWLMEIKTRLLLPTTLPDQPGGADGPTSAADALADPRAELVRQLLAYKRFKDLAEELGEAAAAQALKYPRAGIDWEQLVGQDVEPAVDIADVQIWDLFEAFGKLMEATGRTAVHQVTFDDTPIQEHAADIVDRLAGGVLQFERLFEGRSRGQIVGLFLAMLELIRQKRIRVQQEHAFGPIVLSLRDPADVAKTQALPPETQGSSGEAPPGERRGGRPRRTREEATGPAGVTWVKPGAARGDQSNPPGGEGTGGGGEAGGGEQNGDELFDQGLRSIDDQLKAITIPPDPDLLATGPLPGPESGPDFPPPGTEESQAGPGPTPGEQGDAPSGRG